ncbi:MAG: universal stress protein [Sediminicola sp.]
MKNILFPTDFSENAWNALVYATQLFQRQPCNFHILHAFGRETYGLDSLTLLDPDEAFHKVSEKKSKGNMENLLIRLMVENSNPLHHFTFLSESTFLMNAIKWTLASHKIDMVIMGAKGATDDSRDTYGKNTVAVTDKVRNCPVMVVPSNAPCGKLDEIMLVTDFKLEVASLEIDNLKEMARTQRAQIRILEKSGTGNPTRLQRSNKILFLSHLREFDYMIQTLDQTSLSTVLHPISIGRNCVLMTFIAHQASFLEKLGLVRSKLQQLGYYPNIPMLALHA